MHASTESMCLRRLSDWVYSQSRSQARLRSRVVPVISFMVLSCFIPVFPIYSPIFYYKLRVLPKFLIDNCEFSQGLGFFNFAVFCVCPLNGLLLDQNLVAVFVMESGGDNCLRYRAAANIHRIAKNINVGNTICFLRRDSHIGDPQLRCRLVNGVADGRGGLVGTRCQPEHSNEQRRSYTQCHYRPREFTLRRLG